MKAFVPQELIEQKIFILRGQKVMLDKDLALLYQVDTRDLNKAVSRNLELKWYRVPRRQVTNQSSRKTNPLKSRRSIRVRLQVLNSPLLSPLEADPEHYEFSA